MKRDRVEMDDVQREALGRTLLRAGRDQADSPEAEFLAAFRSKLRKAQAETGRGSFGELCWKSLLPLGAVAAVLTVASAIALATAPESGTYGEKVLWSIASSGPSEDIGDDLILSATLFEGGGE